MGKCDILCVNCLFCGKSDLPVGKGFVLWAKGLCCVQRVCIVSKVFLVWQMVYLVGKWDILWVNCLFCGKTDLPVGKGFVLWANGLCCRQIVCKLAGPIPGPIPDTLACLIPDAPHFSFL
jgi:hypothetical protein